ncbi:MAG: helix-turn-helix transcriptional regulator [Candidatus Latescibacteria bacterium]|nr:helix-turn-helix transcriptional regulator [Candidatus Latescibacterota bacterium]
MNHLSIPSHSTMPTRHIGDEATRQLGALSRRIAEIRERQTLSQQDVATRTRLAQQHVSRLEHGQNCQLLTFLKVCQALGVRVILEEANPLQF